MESNNLTERLFICKKCRVCEFDIGLNNQYCRSCGKLMESRDLILKDNLKKDVSNQST